ncbi:MAG: hypothetical protein AAGA20_07435 [Planctomycetota bacterium]
MVVAVRRVAGCRAALIALASLVTGACQAPCGPSQFAYGAGASCRTVETDDLASLETSLDPLREAFDQHCDVPRMVVLMPHVGCERGAEILRSEVLDAHADRDLRLFVIWQDLVPNPDVNAARRASRSLDDPRVITFHDCSGLAGRAFACGNLPVAQAREVFLFYPAGMRWPSVGARRTASAVGGTPRTDKWIHQLGRVAPERFCTPEELPAAIRATMGRLLRDVEATHTVGL